MALPLLPPLIIFCFGKGERGPANGTEHWLEGTPSPVGTLYRAFREAVKMGMPLVVPGVSNY